MTNHAGNEPTAEQIIEDALRNSYASGSALARLIVSDLHAHGLLSEGALTEAQVEAAAKALHESRNLWFAAYRTWGAAGFEIKQAFRESARAALEAAQGAATQKHPTFEEIGEDIARGIRDSLSGVAPQVPSQNETKSGNNFVSLDPEKGAAQGAAPQVESADCDRDRMGICKRCGMGWDARKVLEGDFACPVLPSSGVDEDKLAEVIDAALGKWEGLEPSVVFVARAVTAWLKGGARA